VTAAAPAIALDGLERRYGERRALAGVTLELPAGATLAVFGRQRRRQDDAAADPRHAPAAARRRGARPGGALPREGWKVRGRIGLLAHDPPALPRALGAREPLVPREAPRGATPARIGPCSTRWEWATGWTTPSDALARPRPAGGDLPRGPARAGLLLLDEPYANLDPAAVEAVAPLVGSQSGCTRVIISHDVDAGWPKPTWCSACAAGRQVLLEARRHVDATSSGALRMSTAVAVSALVRKDLRLELRTRESVPAMLLFSVSTFVIFRFGLDRETLAGDLAAGVLWVTLLFAAVLGSTGSSWPSARRVASTPFCSHPSTARRCCGQRRSCCSPF
jgi:hypothetical protein